MYIIGTAGHVDHGKTLLIKSLTGIDTDRLPEEKKRGLTIDLGFAHFDSPSGEKIGVVDVPGHERFIRNMVAGAWGIDLALMVVAADDGWMYQSGNHLKVLTACGITNIIAVITKADLTGTAAAEERADEVRRIIAEQTGTEPPAVIVSAANGFNIPELKELINERLKCCSGGSGGSGIPICHIDRAFTVRGAGLVVTGSLREGAVRRNDSLLLLPAGKTVRVRGIQTYDCETEKAEPACRAAFNLSGIDSSAAGRGCCLTAAGSGFTAETEFILRLEGDCSAVRNHSEAEFAAGTAHETGTIHLLSTTDGTGIRKAARVVLKNPLPLRFGEPVVIIRKGGSLITGSGRLLWKGPADRKEREAVAAAAGDAELSSSGLMLAVRGWADEDGRLRITESKSAELEKMIAGYASIPGGIRREEIAGKAGVPALICSMISEGMIKSGTLIERNGTLLPAGADKKHELSKNAALILKKAEESGKEGLDLGKSPIAGARKELRTLTREGLIVPLTENLFFTSKVYEELAAAVLEGLPAGRLFDIAHAKKCTGLSRKYIIPLLNRMEEQGFVRREENLRRVIKTF